jgi:hypothetical protein
LLAHPSPKPSNIVINRQVPLLVLVTSDVSLAKTREGLQSEHFKTLWRDIVPNSVGDDDGMVLGDALGSTLGTTVGDELGLKDGAPLGAIDGI